MRLGHATKHLPSFRERNLRDLAVLRRELSRTQTGPFGRISRIAGSQFRVWRGRPFYQIPPRLECRGTVRSSRIAQSSSPGVQARPRFAPPLPAVQGKVMSDVGFAAAVRAAREALLIRPIAR